MKQSLSSHGPDARRNHILQLLQEQGECSVEALAARFAVSSMTIRRDLQILKDGGRIMRTHGGATPTSRISFEFRYLQRAQVQRAAKTAIASKAVELIAAGQDINYEGASGSHEFDDKGDVTLPGYVFYEWKGGSYDYLAQ